MFDERENGEARRKQAWFGAHFAERRLEANGASLFCPRPVTPIRDRESDRDCVKPKPSSILKCAIPAPHLRCGARILLRQRRIREEVIGRTIAVLGLRSTRARGENLARLMLHQPASEHGGGKFLHPLIQHRAHLLAKIRGVSQARKFVALETVTRCRQQELPRGECMTAGHGLAPKIWVSARIVHGQ